MGNNKGKKIANRKSDLKCAIRQYWEDPNTISILDENLHKLEIDTACQYIRSTDFLADIGCGDGEATIQYAKKARRCVGFERSNYLRKKAVDNVKKSGVKNITIKKGDIVNMSGIPEKFDFIVTQRVLINLASWKEQKRAILNIYNALKVGGLYVMIENTNDAFLALNNMRAKVGIKPIPQHWHNLFFDYGQLMSFLDDKFQVVVARDFGLYYFLTRVYVQMFADFVGYGKNAVKDPIFKRSDKAARMIYRRLYDSIHIKGCRALGPIQAFVLRRKA